LVGNANNCDLLLRQEVLYEGFDFCHGNSPEQNNNTIT
jgi:hypothetical protein